MYVYINFLCEKKIILMSINWKKNALQGGFTLKSPYYKYDVKYIIKFKKKKIYFFCFSVNKNWIILNSKALH